MSEISLFHVDGPGVWPVPPNGPPSAVVDAKAVTGECVE
jgi:hypothetical protein